MIRRTIKGGALQLASQRRARRILICSSRETNAKTQPEYRTHHDKAAVHQAIAAVMGEFQ